MKPSTLAAGRSVGFSETFLFLNLKIIILNLLIAESPGTDAANRHGSLNCGVGDIIPKFVDKFYSNSRHDFKGRKFVRLRSFLKSQNGRIHRLDFGWTSLKLSVICLKCPESVYRSSKS